MISPTGKGVRMDGAGSGRFGAPRGVRLHDGIDWRADPGQDTVSQIRGKVNRVVYPYGDDLSYKGLEIYNQYMICHLLYIEPVPGIIGKEVNQGDPVGIAQDVTKRYPEDKEMEPHVHSRFYINPIIFM